MNRELLTEIHEYFKNIPNPTDWEKRMLDRLSGELPYFCIARLHRDDLQNAGFNASRVSDDTMDELAQKLGKDYVTHMYWDSLPILANDLDIPDKETKFCPVCDNHADFDEDDMAYYCMKCGHGWVELDGMIINRRLTRELIEERIKPFLIRVLPQFDEIREKVCKFTGEITYEVYRKGENHNCAVIYEKMREVRIDADPDIRLKDVPTDCD